MALLNATLKKTNNPIPVIGIEPDVELRPKSGSEDRDAEIALRAYYKAEARGYEPGHEIQDWLDAEAEVVAEKEKSK
jgi:Protein of unknown function (DUF2934)